MVRRFLLFFSILALFSFRQIAFAQTPESPLTLVTLAPLERTTPVELTALTVDAEVSEANGHTLVSGSSAWKIHNTDPLNQVTIVVGFPEWASRTGLFDPAKFNSFVVTLDNQRVDFTPATAEVRYDDVARAVPWYTFELELAPDEKKTITLDFVQDLGDNALPRFEYGMLPGNRWKNALGSARISVSFPQVTTGDQFVTLDPILPEFDGKRLTWLWTNLNPESDPAVTFIRPALWNLLVDRRAIAARAPDDVNAHLELGQIYQQLASVESPRRDNFFAQAVAEFETAARLDANNVNAVQTLAELYEQRAGAPNGPRDANYVALAMEQWKKLVSTSADANARKQLAEDSFYLGLDGKAREQYERAFQFFDDARKFAPNGAGPLYTREHWQNEIKTTHIAAAHSAAQAGDIPAALAHTRAAFGDQFDLSPALAPPAFALHRAMTTTSLDKREVVLRLVPYPTLSDAARQQVMDVAAAMNQTGAGTAELDQDASAYLYKLSIPFHDDGDLRNRLDRIAGALPKRADWAVIGAVLDPTLIEWSARDENLTRVLHYREQVDLAGGQAAIQEMLNRLSQEIGTLSSATGDASEAQLKLTLLSHAQEWWHKSMSALVLSYALDAGSGVARDWSVSVGTTRTLEYDTETVRPEFLVIGGIAAGLVVVLGAAALFIIRIYPRARPRRSPLPNKN